MESRSLRSVLDDITTLFDGGTTASLRDGDLLERYLARRDGAGEAAFAAIMERHGPMVLRVCRGVLRDTHDADDAFQATFLILARKAGAIRRGGSVASWLYGVSRRVALRARDDRQRRARREQSLFSRIIDPASAPDPAELMPEIQEEIDRLPAKYRAAVILCDLEGLTHEEAATALRSPLGTVKVQLSRGRERLRGRLLRRGLAPALILTVSSNRTSAAVSHPLARSALSAAMQRHVGTAAGVSTAVASLTHGVLRVMMLAQLKSWAAVAGVTLVLMIASALGVSVFPRPARSGPIGPAQEKPAAKPAPAPAPALPRGRAEGVATQTVGKSDVSRSTDQPATARAFETARLYPAVSGFIKKIGVDLGDRVKAGQVLGEIAAPELEAEMQMSRAVVKKAEAKVLLGETRVKVVEAGQIGLPEVMAKREEARAELLVARADLAVAEAGLRKATTRLSATQITAPFDGVVTQRGGNVGEMIVLGTAQAPAPLLTVARTDKIRVVVEVPDRDVPLLDVGDPAKIRFVALDRTYEGRVSRMAGALNERSGTLRAEIDIPNADERLREGMYGQATIVLDTHRNAIRIPGTAVARFSGDGKAVCYRVVDGHAVRTRITLGWGDGPWYEVLEGLKPGEVVIVNDVAKIKDGQAIEPAK